MGAQPGGVGTRLLGGALVVVAYVLLALAGRELGVFGTVSVWFPPAGLAIVVGLVGGWAALPVLAIAEFASGILVFDVANDFGLPAMVVNAVGYAAVWCAAGAFLRARGLRLPVSGLRDTATTMVVALGAAPAAGALFGMTMRVWTGAATSAFWPDVGIWWIGDAIGVLTLAPALLVVSALRRGLADAVTRRGLPRGPADMALLLAPSVAGAVVFGLFPSATGLLFLVAVPIVVLAMRRGTAGVALGSLPLSLVLTWMANQRIGDLVLERTDLQVLLLGLLVTGYLVAVPADEARRLQARLRRREHDLDEAQRLAAMGSFRWDAATGQVRWSPGLALLYGFPAGHAPGGIEDYLEVVRDDHREAVGRAIGRVAEGGQPVEHTYPVRRRDGAERWVHARVEPLLSPDGTVRGLTGYCQDVTDRRRIDEVRERATERERAAAERLGQAERIKDALLVAVSHEFRTPLTIVSGVVETLRRPDVQEQPDLIPPLVDGASRHLARLDRLLGDLLDTDRLGRGAVVPHLHPTDLHEVVESVLGYQEVTSHPLDVDVAVDTAMVDAGLLGRIIESLLSNGLRYTPEGTPVALSLTADGDDLLVSVADRGPGVPADEHEAIFEPFHQGVRIEHAPGTGLGLSLVARFAELHGGRAWVEDRPGGGAVFRVVFPGALAIAPARPPTYRMRPGV